MVDGVAVTVVVVATGDDGSVTVTYVVDAANAVLPR
jgi:hypothetical protein